MELTGISQLASSIADTQTDQTVGILMLRKALDAETATATELLKAVPPVQNLPPHLGQNINIVA